MDSFQERQKVELAKTESLAQCGVMLFLLSMCLAFGLFMVKRRVGDIMVYLAKNRSYNEVEQLVNLGIGVKARAKDGSTALDVLMSDSDRYFSKDATRVIEKLVAGGAPLNNKFEGKTPLFLAASSYDVELTEKLIKAGADVKIKDDEGRTVLFAIVNHRKALRHHRGSRNDFENKLTNLIKILVEHGVDINARNKEGLNVLAYAPTAASVRLLLKLGVQREVHEGLSPLHGCRFKEGIKELINQGLDPNVGDPKGQTALHRRVSEKEDSAFSKPSLLVSTLLANGAKVDIKDNDGKTPLQIAMESGNKFCTQYLLSRSKITNDEMKELAKKNEKLAKELGLDKDLAKIEKLERSMEKLLTPFAEREKKQKELQNKALAEYLELAKKDKDKLLKILAGIEYIDLIFIPQGTYEMGTRKITVSIPQPFLMSKTEITLAQWLSVMKRNPTRHHNGHWPVTKVTYEQAEDFCKQVARANKRVVRLPSEAEWEYACRAGSKGLYCFSDEEKPKDDTFLKVQETFVNGSSTSLLDVASKRANAWGLFDMNGNAAELCADHYRGAIPQVISNGNPYKLPGIVHAAFAQGVRRGGSFRTRLHQCSTTYRDSQKLIYARDDTGFRIVLPLLPMKETKVETEKQRPGEEMINEVGMKLHWVPSGSFQMGSYDDPYHEEEPVHVVKITRGFWMGAHEVTQSQWKAVTGSVRAEEKGDNLPVTEVSWAEARNYCNSLTKREQSKGLLNKDMAYRLPSEAEWEYACRATTTASTYGPIEKIAWFGSPDKAHLHPVGQKEANAWGLYDMLGNAAEWCFDTHHSNYDDAPADGTPWLAGTSRSRMVRGGMDSTIKSRCRASYRSSRLSHLRHPAIGFRVVLDKIK